MQLHAVVSGPARLAVPNTCPSTWRWRSMSTAQIALDIAGASLGVSMVSVIASVATWFRSGSRLRVRLEVLEHEHDRLRDLVQIEVHNVGRQAAVLRAAQLGRRVQVPATTRQPRFETSYFFDLFPMPTEQSRLIAPTDFTTFTVPMSDVMGQWGEGESLLLHARAQRGDGKILESNVLRVKTPRRSSK
jgi:hypothetical protein